MKDRTRSANAIAKSISDNLTELVKVLSGDEYDETAMREAAQEFLPQLQIKPKGMPYKAEYEVEYLSDGWYFDRYTNEEGREEYDITIPLALTIYGSKAAPKPKKPKLINSERVVFNDDK